MKAPSFALVIGVILVGMSWRLAQHTTFDGHGVVASFPDLWLAVATGITFVGGGMLLIGGVLGSIGWINNRYDE